MATVGEADPSNTSPWSRSGLSTTIKRKVRKNSSKGSDSNSITSSSGGGAAGESTSDLPLPYPPRQNSTESPSVRKLSVVLGSRRKSKKDTLSRTTSNASSEALSRATTRTTGTGSDDTTVAGAAADADADADAAAAVAAATLLAADQDSASYTEDEDEAPKRPPLDSRPSHTGYLTLSSPLIDARTVARTKSSENLTTSSSNTTPKSRSDTLKAPSTSQRRSPSPVGRLKDAFRPSRKNSSATSITGSGKNEDKSGGSDAGGKASDQGPGPGAGPKGSQLPLVFADKALVEEPGEKTPSPKKIISPRTLVTDIPKTPPSDTNGPATIVTPPTPTTTSHSRDTSTSAAGNIVTAPELAHTSTGSDGSRNGASHRRSKSNGQPSKLSNSITAPLTPHAEEPPKLAGGLGPTAGASFFSSVFSAAQNAATSLTSTITAGTGQKSKSVTGTDPQKGDAGGEEVILPLGSESKATTPAGERKELAIETLGAGNLSLSHLGILDQSDISPMQSSTDLVSGIRRDEMAARAEDDAAALAVSNAYNEKINSDRAPSATPSVADTTEQTPVRPATEDERGSIRRAGSVRSRLSGRRRRTRGSSATTTTAMAPVISGPGSTAQKLTGFAVANQKRNKDFHNLFRSVPEDDFLIEDYSAALQRDILLQGRIYISEGHICFSSNILGWVTNLVMSFDEIISVEKKSTAIIFQNGIVIQTLQAKNVFASLLNRDTTYDLIISIWKITHPNLKSSLNGAPVEGPGTGDKTEKIGSVLEEESLSEEVYDEDEEDGDDEDGDGSFVEANEGSAGGSEAGETKSGGKITGNLVGTATANGNAKMADAVETVLTGATATLDFPGPTSHAPTDCGDQGQHLEKMLYEDTIPAPLGKIYSLMFGPASGAFMRKWLVEDQKNMDLQLEDDKRGLDNDKKSMTYSYIKPLGGAIGPKQTKCIINQTLEQFDLNKAVTVACSTQNPDVPSGNIFVVKTRYCLSWAANNSTKFVATCQIEWSGKSWLKGPIEKGANDGQLQYQKDIVAALKAAVTAKSVLKASAKTRSKGGKRKKDSTDASMSPVLVSAAASSKVPAANWGIFEPLRGPLGPVADLVPPSFVIAFLTLMVFVLWWRLSAVRAGSYGSLSSSGLSSPARLAAYEELWRTEESELWKWLEERAGIDGAVPGFLGGQSEERRNWLQTQRVKEMERRLEVDKTMGERKMKEALKITRERLEALERAVGKSSGKDA